MEWLVELNTELEGRKKLLFPLRGCELLKIRKAYNSYPSNSTLHMKLCDLFRSDYKKEDIAKPSPR